MRSFPWLSLIALGLALTLSATPAHATTVTVVMDRDQGDPLDNPLGMVVDGAGNLYVAASNSNNVLRRTPGGTVSVVLDASGDGVHAMSAPIDLALAPDGTLYVMAALSRNVFKRPPNGSWTQILDAGGDGAGHPLDAPGAVVADGTGNAFVSDSGTDCVFRIASNGQVTVVIDASGDGAGHVLDGPSGLAVDGAGSLYVAGTDSDNVFQVTPGGAITEVLTSTVAVPLDAPVPVLVAADGTLYVGGFESKNLVRLPPGGPATVLAEGYWVDSLAFAPNDLIYMGSWNDHAVIGARLGGGPTCTIVNESIAGTTLYPFRIPVLPDGSTYVGADQGKKVVRVTGSACGPEPDVAGAWLMSVDAPIYNISYTSQQTWTQTGFDVSVYDAVTNDTYTGQLSDYAGSFGFYLKGQAQICHPSFPALCCTANYLSGTFEPDARRWSGAYITGTFLPSLICSGVPLDAVGSRCGNGQLDPDENCEDGNLTNGDGCSDRCRIEPCYTCNGVPSTCTLAIRSCASNVTGGGISLKLDAAGAHPAKLQWKMGRGPAFPLAALGDPTATTDYSICAFDRSQPTPTLLWTTAIPSGAGWKRAGTSGFGLKRKEAEASEGITQLTLKAGTAGKFSVKGRGANLHLPTLPLAVPVTLQLQASDAGCFEMTYSPSGVTTNDATKVRARADVVP